MKKKNNASKSTKPRNSKNDLKPILDRMDKYDSRMDKYDKRMDKYDKRMDKYESRMDKNDSRMDRLETRMDKIDERLGDIVKYVLEGRDESRRIAEENDRKISRLLTIMDGMAKDYDRWKVEKLVTDVQVEEHGREITKLKENDAEKGKAIKDLQQRVTALENADNSGPASLEIEEKNNS